MKLLFRIRGITAILLLFLLMLFSALNLYVSFPALKETVAQKSFRTEPIEQKTKTIEDTINENVPARYSFINYYGFLQKLMGKNEENNFEVVKNNNGEMFYEYFSNGAQRRDSLVNRITNFSRTLAKQGTTYLEVMPPDKDLPGYTQFPTGIPNNNDNATADLFLKGLRKNDVSYFDIRPTLSESGINPADMFYKTDHHWTTRTVFWAYTQFVEYLNKSYDLSLDPNHYYTNLKNYNIISYPNSYLGSMGRKTGDIYSGSDDFDLIFPKYATSYTYKAGYTGGSVTWKGRFENILINAHNFSPSINQMDARADKYSTYLAGVDTLGHIVNHNNPKGPKMVFVMDSFGLPFTAFLSNVCSEIWVIDPRHYTGNVQEFVKEKKPDFFVQLVSQPDLVDQFFPYGKQ